MVLVSLVRVERRILFDILFEHGGRPQWGLLSCGVVDGHNSNVVVGVCGLMQKWLKK